MDNTPTYDWQQIGKHITPGNCWIVIEDGVYNVSDFLVQHPGGHQILMKYSGLNATQSFANASHSQYAVSLRNARYVGKVASLQYTEGYQENIKKIKKQQKKKERKIHKIMEPISKEIVGQHKSEEDCWIILNNKVYDVTGYLDDHPGGVSKIMEYAGRDATLAFETAQHSLTAVQKSSQFQIGTMQKQSSSLKYLTLLVLLLIAIGVYFFY